MLVDTTAIVIGAAAALGICVVTVHGAFST